MKQRIGWLIGGSLAFWLVSVSLAHLLWRESVVLSTLGSGSVPRVLMDSVVALLLCLFPTVAVLVWASKAPATSPSQRMIQMLGSGGLRMASVLGMGMLLYSQVPEFQGQPSFWVWVLIFYLVTLVLEIIALARPTSAENSARPL